MALRNMMGVESVLERRRAERQALLSRAREFVRALDPALSVEAALVFGSVARGDFNRWSDVDVLLVGDAFQGGPLDRAEQLGSRPPRVRPVAWTKEEWRLELARGNPIAREAARDAVWLLGSEEELSGDTTESD